MAPRVTRQRIPKMTSSESPLIPDVEHNYGSVTSTSAISQCDGEMANESDQPDIPGFIAKNAGMLFIIVAQFFFTCMSITVKMLNRLDPPIHALEGITSLGCVIYMIVKKIPDPITGPKGIRTLLVIRGITGFFALCGLYWLLQYLSVADSTVLTFLAPLTTALAGSIFLKEGYSIRQAFAGVCSLVGVVLVARPPFLFGSQDVIPPGHQVPEATPAERLVGVGACMIEVLGVTTGYTSIRAIGKCAHPMHVMTFFSSLSTIMAPIGMVIFKIPVVYPRSWTWTFLLFMIGVFGFVAQTLLTMGLQREAVSRGATGLYVQAIFAVVLEGIFFGVILSVLGAAIIISSAIYVVVNGPSDNKADTVVPEAP